MNRYIIGLVMLTASIVLAGILFIPAFHDYYPTQPALFLTLTAAGIVFSLMGSYWVREHIFDGNRKEGFISGLMKFLGDFVVIAGVLAGLISLYVAYTIGVVSGYWGWDWGSRYYFDYHIDTVTLLQTTLLRASIAANITGQFMIGASHKRLKGSD